MSSFLSDGSVDLSPDDIALTEAGILVVDEDPAFQLGLKTFLREYVGFEKVFTARNGREAIELIEQESSIELLTVDYQMPEMDGLELLSYLQENTPRPLGVTMITGFPSDDLKREFANRTSSKLLTNHFLAKPVEFERLEPIILNCYEDLKRSQQLTETMTGENLVDLEADMQSIALAESNRELLAKFDLLDEKLEVANKTIKDLKKSNAVQAFWSNLLKFIIIGLLAFMAWQAGWIDQGLEKMKGIPGLSPSEKTMDNPDLDRETPSIDTNGSNAEPLELPELPPAEDDSPGLL